MGLLSNLISAGKSIVTGTKELIVSSIVTSPLKAITERAKSKIDSNFTTQEKTILKSTAAGVAIVGGGMAVAAAGPVAVITGAVKVAPKIIPAAKGALTTAVAGLVTYGYVSERGVSKSIGDVTNIGGKVAAGAAGAGEALASFIETPTIENGLRIIKEHPYISAAAAVALLGTMGYGVSMIASIISRARTNKLLSDINEGNNATDKEFVSATNNLPTTPPPDKSAYMGVPTDSAPTIPVTPETEVLTPTGKVTKKHYHRKAPTIIKQSMKVLIQNTNRTINKRYLNREILVHA